MRQLTDWFARRRSIPPVHDTRRKRIDLGPTAPTYPIYALGDVHGCLTELKAAEARIAADIQQTGRSGLVVLLGDYVDRGPSSRHVLDHLIKPSELGLKRLPLCGNHDDIFLRFISEPDLYGQWLGLGGEKTLMSYGIDLHHMNTRQKRGKMQLVEQMADAIPEAHRQFLANLPISLKAGDVLFVHAGIQPGVPLEEQLDEDMLWIRDPFITEGPKLPILVVHGHTPKPDPDLGPGRIGIDTGAYYSGKLAILKIDGGRAVVL